MPNVFVHSVTAIPFLLVGDVSNAIGCIAPDLPWIPNEIAIRQSHLPPESVIKSFPEWRIIPFFLSHGGGRGQSNFI